MDRRMMRGNRRHVITQKSNTADISSGVSTYSAAPKVHIHLNKKIFITGLSLCFVTGLPNMNIAGISPLASYIGRSSTSLFGIGGVIGGCKSRWVDLSPALILQLVALVWLCKATEYNGVYRDIYSDSVQ